MITTTTEMGITHFVAPDRDEPVRRLGADAGACVTAAEALRLTGNDFRVVKRDAFASGGPLGLIEAPEQKALVRVNPDGSERVLSYQSRSYQQIQPAEQLAFMDEVANETGSHYDAIAWIESRKALLATMLLPEGVVIDPEGANDGVQFRLFGLNDYRGALSFTVGVTATRLACTNQVDALLWRNEWDERLQKVVRKPADRLIRLRHTKNVLSRAAQARRVLGLTTQYVEIFAEEAQIMYERACRPEMVLDLADMVLGRPDPDAKPFVVERHTQRQETLYWLATESPTNEAIRGTRWGVYNAFTEYLDWHRPVRAKGAQAPLRLAENSLLGPTVNQRARAWRMLASA